ncbi:MAG: dTMP kinase [Saprospiraceae bacterium]|nr:dTMP kinase [Candidatus Vicinibacter affinis]MBP6173011.1 dTMP kinase [Saprospiraceae bacterium]MBK6572898.1 dTMP kinase [Candidatus Vicinibacter affinis]MBK7302595.1 dTMP kinase [Candidatus Vicinibacter affinis]MBK7695929.1 dTMP kinase [Candidatus Vicinibacter affinis]
MANPVFIAFEGIDGSGKSTQAKLLREALDKSGQKVLLTAEPTNQTIGSLIRAAFSGRMEADHRTIAGLFVADRLDHILHSEYGMLPMQQNGYHIICDRYYFSSYAYQGVHMSMDWVIKANSLSADLLRPDLHIFIDVSPEAAMERIHSSRPDKEMYETLDNLKKVRDQYFKAFDLLKDQENVAIINGDQKIESLHKEVMKMVSKYL